MSRERDTCLSCSKEELPPCSALDARNGSLSGSSSPTDGEHLLLRGLREMEGGGVYLQAGDWSRLWTQNLREEPPSPGRVWFQLWTHHPCPSLLCFARTLGKDTICQFVEYMELCVSCQVGNSWAHLCMPVSGLPYTLHLSGCASVAGSPVEALGARLDTDRMKSRGAEARHGITLCSTWLLLSETHSQGFLSHTVL